MRLLGLHMPTIARLVGDGANLPSVSNKLAAILSG